MDVNIGAYLAAMGLSALCACALFGLSARKRLGLDNRKAAVLSGCVLLLGILLGILCAKLCFFFFRFSYLTRNRTWAFWSTLRTEELSYYGGVAGVSFAVMLAARLLRLRPRGVLNAFAPAGAFMAAAARFAEYFLFPTGTGATLDQPLPFPLAIRVFYDEDYSEYLLAVFMFEGILSLAVFVCSLIRKEEPRRFLRTLAWLCIPQIFLESLRSDAINWLLVHVEQLMCFLFVEGVLVWYGWKGGRKSFASWAPALLGLAVCGVIIAGEFALEGKILLSGSLIPRWITYLVMGCALAVLAFAEHLGDRNLKAHSPG